MAGFVVVVVLRFLAASVRSKGVGKGLRDPQHTWCHWPVFISASECAEMVAGLELDCSGGAITLKKWGDPSSQHRTVRGAPARGQPWCWGLQGWCWPLLDDQGTSWKGCQS